MDASQKLCQNTEEHKKKEFTAHLERIKSQIKAESDRLRAGLAARPPVEGTSELYIARKTEELRQLTAPTAALSRFNSETDNPTFKSDLQKLKLDLQKA